MKRKLRNFLTPAGWLWGGWMLTLTLLTVAAFSLGGCAHLNTESRAVALYGSFVIAESSAAELIQSGEISDSVKLQIQRADAEAKPAADALLGAIQGYRKFKGEPEKANLARETAQALGPITQLSTLTTTVGTP